MDMKGSESSFEAKQKVCTDSGLEFMVLLNFTFLLQCLSYCRKSTGFKSTHILSQFIFTDDRPLFVSRVELSFPHWNLIRVSIILIICCFNLKNGKAGAGHGGLICMQGNLLSLGSCTLLHLKESGCGPQILINSPELYFQGWIPENKLNWPVKSSIAIKNYCPWHRKRCCSNE